MHVCTCFSWLLLCADGDVTPCATQRVTQMQAPMEENLPALQPNAWGTRLNRVTRKAAGNALRVTASLLAFSTGQCSPTLLL